MTPQEIIEQFETYVDDTTELSSDQELTLCQKVFNKIWTDRPWEFAKANVNGTFQLPVPNIPLPSDFYSFIENNEFTDNTQPIENNASPKVIFIGSNYQPFQVVNWSDRRQYRNMSGFVYLDTPNNGITFTQLPTSTDLYDYDYRKMPPTLQLEVAIPSIPVAFHPILYHLMAVDDEIILHFPRASSYAPDNTAAAADFLADMALWNAELQNN